MIRRMGALVQLRMKYVSFLKLKLVIKYQYLASKEYLVFPYTCIYI